MGLIPYSISDQTSIDKCASACNDNWLCSKASFVQRPNENVERCNLWHKSTIKINDDLLEWWNDHQMEQNVYGMSSQKTCPKSKDFYNAAT